MAHGSSSDPALRLREFRVELKLTQQALADQLGVTRVTLSGWERGRALPSLAKAVLLEKRTGIPPSAWQTTQDEATPWTSSISTSSPGLAPANSGREGAEPKGETMHRSKTLKSAAFLAVLTAGLLLEACEAGPTGAIPREASFSGLANGSYEIRHTAQARDCSATFTTYAGLEVF